MMYLIVPLSVMVSGGVVQLAVAGFVFCCKFQPVVSNCHLAPSAAAAGEREIDLQSRGPRRE